MLGYFLAWFLTSKSGRNALFAVLIAVGGLMLVGLLRTVSLADWRFSEWGSAGLALTFVAGGLGGLGHQAWELLTRQRARRRYHEGRCTECGYPLTGLSERRCPECGTQAPQTPW